jgi:PAS domain S-box-containing protein
LSKEQEIVQNLSEFGLSGNDIKVLVTLIKYSSDLTANQLARRAGIPRPEVYRILKKLEGRELIQSLLERPKKFKAVKPEMLVDWLLAAERERVNRIASNKARLVDALKAVSEEKEEEREEREGIQILTGMKQVYSKKIALCKSAENKIDYMVPGAGLYLAEYHGLVDILRKCSHRMPVRILTEVDETIIREVEICNKFAELRQISRIPFHTMIIDDKWTIVGIAIDMERWPSNSCCRDIWLNSKGWTRLYQRFFEEMWSSADPFKLVDTLLKTKLPPKRTSAMKGETGLWLVDAEFNTTYVSPRTAEMLGYTSKEMVGKNLEEFCSQRWGKILHSIKNRRKHRFDEVHEFEFLKKGGSPLRTFIYTTPIENQDNQFTGAVLILREKELSKI